MIELLNRNQAVRMSSMRCCFHAPAQSELPHADPRQSVSIHVPGLSPAVPAPVALQGAPAEAHGRGALRVFGLHAALPHPQFLQASSHDQTRKTAHLHRRVDHSPRRGV